MSKLINVKTEWPTSKEKAIALIDRFGYYLAPFVVEEIIESEGECNIVWYSEKHFYWAEVYDELKEILRN